MYNKATQSDFLINKEQHQNKTLANIVFVGVALALIIL